MLQQQCSNAAPSIPILHEHFDNLLENTQISVYWKDKSGFYLGVNSVFLNRFSLKSDAEIIGISDFELFENKIAQRLRANDSQIVHTEVSKLYQEQCNIQNQIKTYNSYKSPLRNRHGKVIGILGYSINVDIQQQPVIDPILFPLQQPNPNQILHSEGLSQREKECLLFMVRGMTAKETAKHINISSRTVEHYIESIKCKWHCKSRSELIQKALQKP